MTGLGPANEGNDTVGHVKTLDTLLKDNGHSDSVINYLKVARWVNFGEWVSDFRAFSRSMSKAQSLIP